ncbi:hypothetical protein C8Q69DRAFT_522497 [Paecilomyces variotii]|uniref:Short-chain dehydrogenase n=1 Tax=Byssochlamys spectabilis TaxID=264951 RepID=A0A443HQI7_BYSSP|nr:hypothetical protein C8Q69DRAFT_522497 [Paecilomyces variotii]RWQ94044.1 hypothetical protein C8Q69DRAFT_522497 [Paecilomyces variotii]
MANSTVVFITGVRTGIGKALAQAYLARSNHIVDTSDASVQELKDNPVAIGSKLLLVAFESTSSTDIAKAIKEIEAIDISYIHLVIANAGVCPVLTPIATVDVNDVITAFNVNAAGPLILFQAVRHLLENSKKSPKWVSMSSAAGSIGLLEAQGCSGNGESSNTNIDDHRAIHSSEKWLTAFAVHPGLVQTETGNRGAKLIGLELAPNSLEESTSKTIAVIDKASRESTSGKFFNAIDGTEIPW